MEKKTCQTCNQEMPVESFYRQNRGRSPHCITCVKAKNRQYRADNIERVKEYDRARGQMPHRKEANRIRSMLSSRDHRKNWVERNREKRSAHLAVQYELRAKRITRPDKCERCNGSYGIAAHHEDYAKQLDVVWLCRHCHGARHREINAERRRSQPIAAE